MVRSRHNLVWAPLVVGALAFGATTASVAGPLIFPAVQTSADPAPSLQQVYYYHGRYYRYHHGGRYYPYRWHGGYYGHRYYRNSRWYYY